MPREILKDCALSSSRADRDFHSLSNGLFHREPDGRFSKLIVQFCVEHLSRLGEVSAERDHLLLTGFSWQAEFPRRFPRRKLAKNDGRLSMLTVHCAMGLLIQ